jgi:hypothetical protein
MTVVSDKYTQIGFVFSRLRFYLKLKTVKHYDRHRN